MNRKNSIPGHGQRYQTDGIGTVSILLAVFAVAIIFNSIYNGI